MLAGIEVFEDEGALAAALARHFVGACARVLDEGRHCAWALTGGSSARLYEALRTSPVDWTRVEVYWGDERAVGAEDPDSNYRVAQEVLLAHVPIPSANVHRMPAAERDLAAAATAYARLLPARLDLVHLGLGDDGHVCSLFPGHALLHERERRVRSLTDSPKPPPRRLTLTPAVLDAAHAIVISAMGEQKAAAVRAVLDDVESQLPAALVLRGPAPVKFLIDRAAAADRRHP